MEEFEAVGMNKAVVMAQTGNGECSCSKSQADSNSTNYVYTIGKIKWRFPNQSIEKEFAQAAGRVETAGLSDRQTVYEVLSGRQNRYLVRQLCWILTIEGLETYLLLPRDPADFDLLVDAIRPVPSPMDIDVVIGVRGPVAPPQMCNGLMVPIVGFDQIYSFDRDSLIQAIPRPDSIGADTDEQFRTAGGELFDRIMQLTDNAGATPEHRALNYVAVRYPSIYAMAVDAYGRSSSMTAVETRPSRLSSTRTIIDIIFSFTNRNTDVTEKYFVRVDVTEEFPFLVTKLSPYFDR